MRAVTATTEQRRNSDRRKVARGGRRPTDKTGFAPLILVADEDDESGQMCEVILAKLRFAVARVDSLDKAIDVLPSLRPDVIVARARDVSPLQRAAWPSGVPFVSVTDEIRGPDALIDAIRAAIRNGTRTDH
jgi:hypothetical protein